MKNKLGIGGVSVSLEVPGQIAKDSGAVVGKIILTTKSDQELVSYKVKIYEEFTTGRGDDKKTKIFDLGTISAPLGYSIKPGEPKEIEFSLPFNVLKSNNDELKEKGGALGALGKMGSFADNEKSVYFIDAEVDVKAAALDPSSKKEIRLV
ncbi:MAG: hypothetical protein RBS19_05300 [Bacteroidales bacterium]|nr:hypothetical protein [Bacteroidales bacterium]MDY0216352.1 hypothetical protein [Bacteroidales bacterium]